LGWGGSFEQPVARNATRPMLFSIPAGLLREGRNWIDVYVVAEPVPRGFLDKLYLAPIEVLEAAYHEHGIFRHEIPRAIALSLLVISLFIGVLWFYRRRETEYGLFALASLCWAVNAMDQFVVDIPLPVFYWDWLMMLSLSGFVFLGVMFVHRFLHEAHPQVERLMLMIGVPVVLLCLVLPRTYAYLVVLYVWNPVLLVYGAYVLLFILHKIGQQYASRELYALVLAIAVIFIFASYDFTVQMGWRSQVNGMFLHFGAPVLMLSFTWILLRRFVSSLQATETYNRKLLTLNQELEQRVAERGRRIAESYETIRQFEQREVLLNERSRIMRDMHDGIGVYLTSMLRQLDTASIDREQLRDSARNALNDLRLMIDSLGNASTDLSAMLGMFRTRISAVLDACGMELEWAVDELPQVADFGPERALNLLRILQEAVTNAVKHSGSERVSLSAGTELQPGRSNRIKIEIRDNGKGFVDERPGGNGLKNMQYRAKKIQAELAVSSDGQGTSVTVYLPVAAGQGDSMTLAQSGGRLNGVAGTRKK
ncbi:MAG TPA: 7TM diverse intracellular signaling domain-containing protein, partial [Thiolinea sp.]|nr:7TM diverse intracellular signaling domain-containing protein [Thiolinea sp.]